jgi:hypothetical protein
MWRASLLLLWGGVALSQGQIQGPDIPKGCEAKKVNPNITCTFDIGTNNATLVAHGDIDDGCKFIVTNRDGSERCCYMDSNSPYMDPNSPHKCKQEDQDRSCRDASNFLIVENKITYRWQQCMLFLSDFQSSDEGEYQAVFLRNNKHKRRFNVRRTATGLTGGAVAGITISVLLIFALVMCGLYRKFELGPKTEDWRRRNKK